MFRRFKVIYRKIRSDGLISGMSWLITRLYHRVIPQKQVIWSTDLTLMDAEGFSLPDDLKIQRVHSIDQVNEDDLKILMECKSELMGSVASIFIRDRFNKGAVLWLYKVDGNLAGYCWTIVKNHSEPAFFPLTDTDVHFVGTEIFPDFRGGDLFRLFDEATKINLKKEGSRRYFSETYLWNERAVKAILKKTSARKIGIATRFSIFGKNIVIWHDMSSKIAFK